MELMKSLRTIFPSFFEFWRNQMVRLYVENYSSRLLDTLGPPKSLRELLRTDYLTETHPSLLQLETIEIGEESVSIKFFRLLGRSCNLKRLRVNIMVDKSLDEIRNSKPFDQLERIQIILDAKRHLGSDFHLDIYIDYDTCDDIEEDKLRQFLDSFGASASTIRMFNVPSGFAEQFVSRLPNVDERATKKFLNSIHSYHHFGDLCEISCLISERHLFVNLKELRLDIVDIPEENEDEFMNSEDIKFPSGVESIEIFSEKGVIVPRNLPASLKSLSLKLYKMSSLNLDRSTTAIELVESLSLISRSCPLFEKLYIEANIVVPSSGPPLTNALEDPTYAFRKLKSLHFWGNILGEPQQKKSVDGEKRLCEILLFDILRVEQMPLLELSLQFWDGNKMELDSGCVERLLKSPLASSLIKLRLDCKVNDEAKDSFNKLQSIVEENGQKRRR